MREYAHLVRAGWLAWLLASFSLFATPTLAFAGHSSAAPPAPTDGAFQYVRAGTGGSLTLEPDAPPAPPIYGTFKHFGLATSPKQLFTSPFQQLRVTYDAYVPASARVRIDLRASVDGKRWSAWEIDLPSGALATFQKPMFFAQYRATLLSNGRRLPTIGELRLAPQPSPAVFSVMSDDEPIAPTWKLRATREGMVGHHTANGHKIKPHDHYVSLPSWRALSPDGTNDYQVRITYNGRSAVAPVYDVGPWNAHDDYWNEQRERYQDLPRGWPEDHAAYYDKYNGGRAEKGKVRFPTAVDIGDGVWWDELGIKGDQATVEITFLWLGKDPLAAPAEPAPPPAEAAPVPPATPPAEAAPAPAAPSEAAPPAEPAPAPPSQAAVAVPPQIAETVVDDGMQEFQAHAALKWYDGPKECGANGHALWTYTTPDPAESENSARWQPALASEALYDVYAMIPGCKSKKPATNSAHYLVQHRDGSTDVVVDQAAQAGQWVLLGRFPFRAGADGFVELRDVAGESMRTIWFDAVKWVPVP